MDEQMRQQIMQAMLGQGILGQTADMSSLQPIWQKMNIDRQMEGYPALPQFRDWYGQIRQQMPDLFTGTPSFGG